MKKKIVYNGIRKENWSIRLNNQHKKVVKQVVQSYSVTRMCMLHFLFIFTYMFMLLLEFGLHA